MKLARQGTLICLLVLGLFGGFLVFFGEKDKSSMISIRENAIFAPGTPRFESFDPLDADRAVNLSVMRMLYLTPVEVTPDNRLTSQILESFGYDPLKKTITFVVRKDRSYSDGTPISPDDVAFAIARMAEKRPSFPVLSEILGLEAWRGLPGALNSFPEGLRVNGQTVSIELNRDVPNALFRFCLEIFSIIPRASVDPATNELKVDRPPFSGNYQIKSLESEKIVFEKRLDPIESHGLKIPDQVTFVYFKSDPDFKEVGLFPEHMVVSGTELNLFTSQTNLSQLGYSVTWTPASSYSVLLINPEVPAFRSKACRQQFAATFRSVLSEIFMQGLNISGSLFPTIVPGFVSDLGSGGTKESTACAKDLAGQTIPWATYPVGQSDFFREAIVATASRLGLELQARLEVVSQKELEQAYLEGKSSFFLGRSGFWPLDAVGDIRMLFTPNMHPALRFVWSDEQVMKHLSDIRDSSDPILIKSKMEELNRYVFDQAIFNPVAHFRRFLASTGKNTLREVPLAVQTPYPWQAFRVN